MKSYITDGGKYYLAVAENAHAAVNNILAKKGYSVDGASAEFVKEYDVKEDLSVTKSQYTDEEITNKFDDADVNKAELGIGKVTYLSRSDWQGTYAFQLVEGYGRKRTPLRPRALEYASRRNELYRASVLNLQRMVRYAKP